MPAPHQSAFDAQPRRPSACIHIPRQTVYISGTITSDTIWTAAAGPYVIDDDLLVSEGVTLTIEAGAVVKFDLGTTLEIRGRLLVQGQAGNEVIFTSLRDDVGGDTNGDGGATTPARGDWVTIDITHQGQAVFDYAVVRYGGYGSYSSDSSLSLNWAGSELVVSNSTITESETNGITTWNETTLVVTNTTISNNGRAGIYGCDSEISVTNSRLTNNGWFGIWDYGVSCATAYDVYSNTITGNQRDGINVSGEYLTLDIEQNVITGNLESGLVVGNLVTITNNLIAQNGSRGITFRPADGWLTATVSGNSILSNTEEALMIDYDYGAGMPVFTNNTIAGNGFDGPPVLRGRLDLDSSWPVTYPLGTAYVVDFLTLYRPDASLTIEPGVVVKFSDGGILKIQGELVADGTEEQPIVFTSLADDSVGGDANGDAGATLPNRGDWCSIIFDDGRGVLDHVVVYYGGCTNEANIETASAGSRLSLSNSSIGESDQTGLRPEGGVVTVTNTLIGSNNGYGIEASNTTMNIEDCAIVDNGWGGIRARWGSATVRETEVRSNDGAGVSVYEGALDIQRCTVAENDVGIEWDSSDAPVINNNSIYGNTTYGIENTETAMITADNNWWGHPTGPHHTTNPGGAGDEVSDRVSYAPWLGLQPNREPVGLTLGQLVTRTVDGFQFQDYYLSTTAGQSIVVEVTPVTGTERLWIFGQLNALPQWSAYNLRTQDPTGRGTYELLIPSTEQGTYYFGVYAFDAASSHQIVARTADRYTSDLSPRSAGNAGETTLLLYGLGFNQEVGVELHGNGLPTLTADHVSVASPTTLWAHFDLTGITTGTYDISAIWPDMDEMTLHEAFTVTTGVGPQLEASLITPARVRNGRQSVLWLEYANVGDADLPAPLFVISSWPTQAMRLSSSDSFAEQPIQILGIDPDQPAGILRPGSSNRVAIEFRAHFGEHQTRDIEFSLTRIAADSTAIDWNAVEAEVRPPQVSSELWAVIWPRFQARAGATWADYVQMLRDQATYLAQYGGSTHDVNKLFAAAFARASGTYLRQYVGVNTDSFAPAPGLALEFSRVAMNTLDQRFSTGPLVRGWSHSFEFALTQSDPNTIIVTGPGGSARRFTRVTASQFEAGAGDFGILAETGDGYRLREKDGLIWQFDEDGRLLYLQEPNGNRITLGYSADDLTSLTHSNGWTVSLQTDGLGRIESLIDHAGQTILYGYDEAGTHLLTVEAPGGITTTYTYISSTGALNHALDSVTYPNGVHQYYSYDSEGRLAAAWLDGGVEQVTYQYNTFGSVAIGNAEGFTSTLHLGYSGQLLEMENPLGNRVRFEYDDDLNLVRLIRPDNIAFQMTYDNQGNLTSVMDPLDHITEMGYTSYLNRPDWLRDANGNMTDYAYDDGNLTAITYVDGSFESLTYDDDGNLSTITNRRGQIITYTHNSLGQVVRKDYPDGRWITYTYNTMGYVTSVGDMSGTIDLEYDDRGFLTRIDYPSGHWFTFSYNDAGQRTERTGDDGYVLNYHYDPAGRLERITDGAASDLVHYEYSPAGRVHTETRGNGTYTVYSYDGAGQVLTMTHYAADDSVQSFFAYTYDANGNRTSMTTAGGTTTYSYDALGRLVGATYPGGRTVTYAYDPVGNRISVTDDGITTTYSTNDLNQYTHAGNVSCTFDDDGNLTSSTDAAGTTTYEYDAENRLVRVTTPTSGTWEYVYDVLGNRAAVIHDGAVTQYVHDPIGLIDVAAEYDGSNNLVAHYVHGLGLVARVDDGGNAAYYAFDAIGNTRYIIDDVGAVANSYDYDVFGIPLVINETITNPFRYVGRFGVMSEGHGLDYMRARYYQPTQGRFTAVDPTRTLPSNLYTYAGNNPAGYIDPLGLWQWPFSGEPLKFGGVFRFFEGLRMRQEAYGRFCEDPTNTEAYEAFRGASRQIYESASAAVDDLSSLANYTDPPSSPWDLLDPFLLIVDALRGGGLVGSSATSPASHPSGAPMPPSDTHQDLGAGSSAIVQSVDPNEKAGPAGIGAQQIVSTTDTLEYVIYFENVISATAPAQEVFIVDDLDPDLDWSTLEFAEFAFGDRVVIPSQSAGSADSVVTIQDYREGVTRTWTLDISAQVDYQVGQVRWTFRTLNPETGRLPDDPLAGFLPPNDETGRGEGHVSFYIRPQAELVDGTMVTNAATIVFDFEQAIETNEVWNTIGTPDYAIYLPFVLRSE